MINENLLKIAPLFRIIAIAEGISFLVLLLIAMPLKYFANLPLAVTYFGWAHGVLFITYLALAFELGARLKKNFLWLVVAFIAAIMPFGTFIFERQLKIKKVSK